jgi:hypothetical protein
MLHFDTRVPIIGYRNSQVNKRMPSGQDSQFPIFPLSNPFQKISSGSFLNPDLSRYSSEMTPTKAISRLDSVKARLSSRCDRVGTPLISP